jgi:hypothetical protein
MVRNGRAGDAGRSLGDADHAKVDASGGAGDLPVTVTSVPQRPHPPESSRTVTPNGDGGDAGDGVSAYTEQKKKRERKERFKDRGKTASPPSPPSPALPGAPPEPPPSDSSTATEAPTINGASHDVEADARALHAQPKNLRSTWAKAEGWTLERQKAVRARVASLDLEVAKADHGAKERARLEKTAADERAKVEVEAAKAKAKQDAESTKRQAAEKREAEKQEAAAAKAREREEKRAAASAPAPSLSADADADANKPKLAEVVIAVVEQQADLFHDPKGDVYATITGAAGVERTMRLDAGAFRAWMALVAREATGQTVNKNAIEEARLALQGIGLYQRDEKPVHVRVAEHDGALYLDLGDDTGACVECKPDGWTEMAQAPVKFLRPSGLRRLQRPVRGGSVGELRPFVNVSSDESFSLLLAWLVGGLRPGRPFPILAFQGEQGTAKTTAARVARRLIDPNIADVRSPPRCEDDLMVMAHNSHVVSVDNLSGLPGWLSDAFCRIATGGGLSKRAHYENADEVIVEALRPTILNGIDDIASRADLAERSIVLTLEPIAKRQDEATFWRRFDEAAPRILGALLDAVCCALANLDRVQIDDLPRMADFARWATAAEPALGLESGSVLRAYTENLAGAATVALEASPVAVAVRKLVAGRASWEGTAEELLGTLNRLVSLETMTARGWPKDGARLSGALRRAAVPLRAGGVDIEFAAEGRGKDRRRRIKLGNAGAAP